MDIITSIVDSIEKEKQAVNSIIEAAARIIESGPALKRLGLIGETDDPEEEAIFEFNSEGMTQVRKGDIILDTGERAVYVATGEFNESGKVVARGMGNITKAMEPEFILVGQYASDPMIKKAAGRLATSHPDRRVLTYGAMPGPAVREGKETTSDKSSVHNDTDPWCTWVAAGEKKNKEAEAAPKKKAKPSFKRKGK